MLSAKEFFSENGILSEKLEFYEFRPEQLNVAMAVEEAIEADKPLLAEAGPGVGKSMAYLVPFMNWALEADRKVVVSTYTKALQNQLFVKDLPLLRDILGREVRYALCMGSENYVCLRRADLLSKEDLFQGTGHSGSLDRIIQWIKTTPTGLVTDMDFVPESRYWEKFRREADLCSGKRCRYYGSCFFMNAKKEQSSAHILITNHALLFSALRKGANVLPDFDGLVIDEAHTLEDVATGHFGAEFSSYAAAHLLARTEELLKLASAEFSKTGKDKEALDRLAESITRLRAVSERFFSEAAVSCGVKEVPAEFDPGEIDCRDIKGALAELRTRLIGLGGETGDTDISDLSAVYAERADGLAASSDLIFGIRPEGYVFWASGRGTRPGSHVSFNASPIDISSHMRENIFERISRVVLTSATISASSRKGDFTFFKERIGLDDPLEVAVDSPYFYGEKVLFYIPPDISDPVTDKAEFKNDLVRHITGIYDVMGGRIFALFTSYEMLNAVASSIAEDRPDIYVLKQGDMPRYVLLDVFRKNRTGMLMGTSTFWQGVDVPGSSLECVIVTRFPFGVPTDPVNSARIRDMRNSGRNPFTEYQLPQALIMFKQGFGRLIRSHSDRGVFAVLDPRIRTKEYGRKFLEYLPKCEITGDIEDIRSFFSR